MTSIRQALDAVLHLERDLRLLNTSAPRSRPYGETTIWLDELIESIVSEPKPKK